MTFCRGKKALGMKIEAEVNKIVIWGVEGMQKNKQLEYIECLS